MESKLKYKKSGFAASTVGLVVTLIVGVGVATLVLIFVGTLGGQTYNVAQDELNAIGNTSVVNQTFFANNLSATTLGYSDIHTGSLSILNGTSPVALNNFTINYADGTILLTSTEGFNNTYLNASYNYGAVDIQTSVKNGIKAGFGALEQTGDYLPLIVLAVVITLVMALVLSLGGMGSYKGGSAL